MSDLMEPPPPDGAGIAAIYRQWAEEHFRDGLIDFRSLRPVRSAEHTRAGRRLQRAALAEQFDPVPPGLPGSDQPGP